MVTNDSSGNDYRYRFYIAKDTWEHVGKDMLGVRLEGTLGNMQIMKGPAFQIVTISNISSGHD